MVWRGDSDFGGWLNDPPGGGEARRLIVGVGGALLLVI